MFKILYSDGDIEYSYLTDIKSIYDIQERIEKWSKVFSLEEPPKIVTIEIVEE